MFIQLFPKDSLNQEFDANHLNRVDFIYLTLSKVYVQCLYTSLSHHKSANLPHKFISYKNNKKDQDGDEREQAS